jgi:cytochrome c556
MHLKLKATIAGALALSLAAGAAFAQPAAGGRGAALKAACGADFEKYCPNVQMGPDMRACVRTNYKTLSDGCKSVLQQLRSAHQEHSQGGAAAPQ